MTRQYEHRHGLTSFGLDILEARQLAERGAVGLIGPDGKIPREGNDGTSEEGL